MELTTKDYDALIDSGLTLDNVLDYDFNLKTFKDTVEARTNTIAGTLLFLKMPKTLLKTKFGKAIADTVDERKIFKACERIKGAHLSSEPDFAKFIVLHVLKESGVNLDQLEKYIKDKDGDMPKKQYPFENNL